MGVYTNRIINTTDKYVTSMKGICLIKYITLKNDMIFIESLFESFVELVISYDSNLFIINDHTRRNKLV